MKTAEEWANQHFDGFPKQGIISDIKAIQLDAFKAGMTRAGEMVDVQSIHSDFSLQHPHGAKLMCKKILTARDNFKEI